MSAQKLPLPPGGYEAASFAAPLHMHPAIQQAFAWFSQTAVPVTELARPLGERPLRRSSRTLAHQNQLVFLYFNCRFGNDHALGGTYLPGNRMMNWQIVEGRNAYEHAFWRYDDEGEGLILAALAAWDLAESGVAYGKTRAVYLLLRAV